MKTPVLFTNEKSNYHKYANVDCYDKHRNALSYVGIDRAIICHPPCRLFSRMHTFSNAEQCEKFLGYWAISKVRNVGGIVENPYPSKLFNDMKCGKPNNPDQYGGYLIKINLSDFGFPARKPTGLYICGCNYRELPGASLSFNAIEFTISNSKKKYMQELPKNKRSETPDHLIVYLLKIINVINKNKYAISTILS